MSKIIPFTRANHEEEVYLERCLNLTLCCKEKKSRVIALLKTMYDDDYHKFKSIADEFFDQREELVSSAWSFHDLLKSESTDDYQHVLRPPKGYEWNYADD